MVTPSRYITNGDFMSAITLWGKSTDTKPTHYGNGSRFIEMDTSKIYLFDAEGSEWHEWGADESEDTNDG